MNKNEKLNIEYNQFSQRITSNVDVPMYEWLLMAQYACGGLENAVRVVKDAYRFGFEREMEHTI